MSFNKCVLFVNLWNYDPVLPIPQNSPENVNYIYVTDTDENVDTAKKFGYVVYQYNTYLHITDKFERIKIVAKLKCFPEEIFPELQQYKYIFQCDANILKFDMAYTDFINSASDNYAIFVTTGWYSGEEDNIYKEYYRSINTQRWSYNFENMTKSFNKYLELFEQTQMNPYECKVVSAKYVGFNIQHKNKKQISNFVYNEYMNHLQGNIIYSVALNLFPQDIFHFRNGFFQGEVIGH
jgi:hypothetical protein